MEKIISYKTIDGTIFETESEAKEYELRLSNKKEKRLSDYKNTYSYKELIKRYSLDTQGVWEVRGEDPNCDFGGYHHEPYISTVEGKLTDVIDWAVQQKNFFTWGGGGRIKKVEISKVK